VDLLKEQAGIVFSKKRPNKDLYCHTKDFGIYFKCDKNLLEDLEQENIFADV